MEKFDKRDVLNHVRVNYVIRHFEIDNLSKQIPLDLPRTEFKKGSL
jgi:hypothetical protein